MKVRKVKHNEDDTLKSVTVKMTAHEAQTLHVLFGRFRGVTMDELGLSEIYEPLDECLRSNITDSVVSVTPEQLAALIPSAPSGVTRGQCDSPAHTLRIISAPDGFKMPTSFPNDLAVYPVVTARPGKGAITSWRVVIGEIKQSSSYLHVIKTACGVSAYVTTPQTLYVYPSLSSKREDSMEGGTHVMAYEVQPANAAQLRVAWMAIPSQVRDRYACPMDNLGMAYFGKHAWWSSDKVAQPADSPAAALDADCPAPFASAVASAEASHAKYVAALAALILSPPAEIQKPEANRVGLSGRPLEGRVFIMGISSGLAGYVVTSKALRIYPALGQMSGKVIIGGVGAVIQSEWVAEPGSPEAFREAWELIPKSISDAHYPISDVGFLQRPGNHTFVELGIK